MDKTQYLLNLAKTSPEKVRDTWIALGSLKVNSNTKLYIPETLFKVEADDSSALNGAIVYCLSKYQVDGKNFPTIDWSSVDKDGIEGDLIVNSGIMTPFFKVILLSKDIPSEQIKPIDTNIIPFSDESDSDSYDVNISDKELIIILNEVGIPFLRFDEIEYSKKELIDYCIKPALDKFYTFFPIIKEQAIGTYSSGAAFKIEFPETAYSGIPYYTMASAGGGGNGASYGMGAFSLFREQLLYGTGTTFGQTGGYGFGHGITYSKPVPGFTGRYGGMASTMLDPLAVSQGYSNYFRREKFHKVKENGKWYMTGFSTIGGYLNVKWLCSSNDWDDVPFSLLSDVRDLCKAYVMRSLSSLRSLVKSDIPGNIDYSSMASRANDLEKEVIDRFKASITNQNLSLMRGGL